MAVALVVVGLIVGGQISGLLAIILGVLAGIFLLTSVVSFRPLYMPLGRTFGWGPVRCRRRDRCKAGWAWAAGWAEATAGWA